MPDAPISQFKGSGIGRGYLTLHVHFHFYLQVKEIYHARWYDYWAP